jgi:hypothetical protein
MANKQDVWQGTLALMILKTLETLGPQHGYGIARRIEQTSGNLLLVNYGTLYPALLKLEQEGYIASEWGCRTTTVGRSIAVSRGPVRSSSRARHVSGNKPPKFSLGFWERKGRRDERPSRDPQASDRSDRETSDRSGPE